MNRARSRRRKEADFRARSFSASLRRRLRGSWSRCAPQLASRLRMNIRLGHHTRRVMPGLVPCELRACVTNFFELNAKIFKFLRR